jgi:PKD repeat protein
MKKGMLLFLLGMGLVLSMFNSCEEDPSLPTAVIYATIDGYQVSFAPTVTDASTYTWDFGDESGTSTEANPVYTYESFGEYSVSLTVTGDGGSVTVTKLITIAATSFKDLLTGGAKAADGKTWILSTTITNGFEGGGPIMNAPYELGVIAPDNVLTMFGLGDEYDNEYTFYFDGSYKITPKNGNILASLVFAYGMGMTPVVESWDIGLCSVPFTAPTGATWEHKTTTLTVDAIGDPEDLNQPPAHAVVTFTGEDWIQFTGGAFFGIYDFPSGNSYIIDEITSDKMKVSFFVCTFGNDGGDPLYNMMPATMYHLTFVKK